MNPYNHIIPLYLTLLAYFGSKININKAILLAKKRDIIGKKNVTLLEKIAISEVFNMKIGGYHQLWNIFIRREPD